MFRSMMISLALASGAAFPGPTAAQDYPAPTPPPAIKRMPLQRFDVPGTAYETVIGIAVIAPNTAIGRHLHPGPVSGYVMAGGLDVVIDGQAPRRIANGGSFVVPARVTHDEVSGPDGAVIIATYVIEKGQALVTPTP